MVDQPRSQTVELRLAGSGEELAAAIEAAQFARVIDQGSPEEQTAAAAVQQFADLFVRAAESWDQLGAAARAGLLRELGLRMDGLARRGWFVHWATGAIAVADRRQAPLQLPLAILSVSRSRRPTLPARIPGALSIQSGSGAVH
jgi:hypothetical protein